MNADSHMTHVEVSPRTAERQRTDDFGAVCKPVAGASTSPAACSRCPKQMLNLRDQIHVAGAFAGMNKS
jgi:hypothetical protein